MDPIRTSILEQNFVVRFLLAKQTRAVVCGPRHMHIVAFSTAECNFLASRPFQIRVTLYSRTQTRRQI